jgi:NAD(P)-dependent dehydrogenase (short-subunit alcohol dehydrogenase family)
MELENRIAFITGSAKGMGAAATLKMADQGADLILAGRDLAPVEEVAEEARRRGRRVVVVGCDVAEPEQVEEAVKLGCEAFEGRIDVLVNIAGGSGPIETSFVDTLPEDFDDILRVNMKGCFLTMRAVLPIMKERRYGKIVNVGGTFGLRGRAFRMAYSASKWGLRGITKSAALEFGEYNINVNSVCPGMVDGPRFERVCAERAKRLGISVEESRRQHGADYALKRVSTADDVAEAILFFASDRSRNITGQDLAVDGGWVI